MAKSWRDSASLIILARNHSNAFSKGHNYKILLFKRSERTSFMPNGVAFPGGAVDSKDESKSWLKHFQKFGITDSRLNELTNNIKGERPPIYRKSPNTIAKEISLRISAIRETFEEVGVLICRKKDELKAPNSFGYHFDEFDKVFWQNAVHNDASKFLELCEKLNVVPDLWSLHEWSSWLTPSYFKKRFETAFFLVALNKVPDTLAEKGEVAEIFVKWDTPTEYLNFHKNEKIWLPPPQFYELLRFRTMPNIDILMNFAESRNSKGTTLFLPVQYTCTDGVAMVLPGDSAYPEHPNDASKPIDIKQSLEEFRQSANKLHRNEYRGAHSNTLYCTIDPPNGHLKPYTKYLDAEESKL